MQLMRRGRGVEWCGWGCACGRRSAYRHGVLPSGRVAGSRGGARPGALGGACAVLVRCGEGWPGRELGLLVWAVMVRLRRACPRCRTLRILLGRSYEVGARGERLGRRAERPGGVAMRARSLGCAGAAESALGRLGRGMIPVGTAKCRTYHATGLH